MTASISTARAEDRSSLFVCAVFSAISLALPTGIFLLAVMSGSPHVGVPTTVMALAIAAALGIAYAWIALAARGSGAAMIAGVSTTLCVLGVVALVPILLLASLDSMSGGHSMGTIVVGALVYVVAQFALANAARGLAGSSQKVRTSTGFQLGVALPLVCGLFLSPLAKLPANREIDRSIANVRAREKTRGDLFALYACATAHRALSPQHDYPAALEALGAKGDKCLPAAIATGAGGFRFEYTPRMSAADSVAGFTVRAIPKAPDPNATMLTMDEHAIIHEDYVDTRYAALYQPTPPGLDMLVAMRDCERLYRHYRHRAPSDLRTLRAFGDSTLERGTPNGCYTLRSVESALEWADYGQAKKLNEWTGAGYTLTFHPAGDSSSVAYEVRPKTYGATGIWSYLALSPGAMYGTTEPRTATTADVTIPVCEFGAPPAGSPQCIPGSSPPPNARLMVDSVVDSRGFTIALVGAADSTGAAPADSSAHSRPDATTAEFQYAFSCDGMENNVFKTEASRTCHPNWHADSVQVRARIRNRDLTMREYTRWVHVKRPPLAIRLAAPKSVVLGDTIDLHPIAAGRDSTERFELTVRIGDAFPMNRSDWLNGLAVPCIATPGPRTWECSYPTKPGAYRVTVTAKSWKGDTASASGKLVVRRPRKSPSA